MTQKGKIALSVKDVVKVYKKGVKALQGVNLDVHAGDFFGLLGPNGAGKTTLLSIISTLVDKTSGTIKVNGKETSRGLFTVQEKSKLVKKRYVDHKTPVAINIYKDYTVIALLSTGEFTFLIKNENVADSFREYFKVMWQQAKP